MKTLKDLADFIKENKKFIKPLQENLSIFSR